VFTVLQGLIPLKIAPYLPFIFYEQYTNGLPKNLKRKLAGPLPKFMNQCLGIKSGNLHLYTSSSGDSVVQVWERLDQTIPE
jgi:hypothetical protein